MKTEKIRGEVLAYLQQSDIETFSELWSILGEIFEKYLDPEFIFYFEKEDLLEEVRLIYGSARAYSLKQDQYFSQFRIFAFENLDREPRILAQVPIPLLKLNLLSTLLFPIYFTEASRGIWVLGNPRSKKRYSSRDLTLMEDIFSACLPLIETLKLKRIVQIYQREQRLTNRLHKLLDANYELAQFLKYLIEIIEETLLSRIVVFLVYDEVSGQYSLEAGNPEGCEFWANQEDFFKGLATQTESQGVFSKTYSGKHFRGEKFGLDRLETALVVPMKFYERNLGAFILLNKKEQQNFTDLDVKMMQILVRNSKGVICREKEKDSIVNLFKKFVSDKIVREILENPTESLLREERKFLTVLFIDLNHFTALSERISPSQVIVQLNQFLAAMTELVFQYGGTLDKYMGDEIMALFGSPIAMEQHAHRAVECALAMQESMKELCKKWKEAGQEALTASIGICTGNAVVGTIGCDQYVDYTAIGDTVNIASRITQAAPEATILIGKTTLDLMGGLAMVGELEQLRLRGRDTTVSVYELKRLKDEQELKLALEECDDAKRILILHSMAKFLSYQQSDLVRTYAREGSRGVRIQALETLITLNRQGDVALLLELATKEEDPAFRSQILDAVSKISGEAVIALLRDYLQDLEPIAQVRIIDSLGYEDGAENKRLLLPLLSDVSHEVRASVAHAIYRFGDSTVLEILLRMLHSRESSMKLSAVEVLGKIGTTQVIRPLVQLISSDPSKEIAYAVARALGRLTNIKSLQYLAHLITDEPSLQEWRVYVDARKDLPTEERVCAYRRVLNSMNPYVVYAGLVSMNRKDVCGLEQDLLEQVGSGCTLSQIEAIDCLSDCPNSKVMPAYLNLLELSEGTEIHVMARVLREIGRRGLTQFVEILHKFLKNEDPELQVESAKALAELSRPSSVDRLLQTYYEVDHANLKATIIRALGSFSSQRIIPVFLEGLRSPIARIRANAVDSLVHQNYVEAVPMIRPLLQDENNRVRANAALALYRFGQQDIYSFLDQMLSSDDKWMRLSAIWTLGEIGGAHSHEIIMKHLNDSDYDVKLRAILSLNKLDQKMLNLFIEMMEAS